MGKLMDALYSNTQAMPKTNPDAGQSSPSAGDFSYQSKVAAQIEQFVDQPIHDLPEIFHLYSDEFIRRGMEYVFGTPSINEFYVGAVSEVSKNYSRSVRILSIGCGDGAVEIDIARALLGKGFKDFSLEALDLSPVLIERFESLVRAEGLSGHVFPAVKDLNFLDTSSKYDVVVANHCLHHIVELERVFDIVRDALTDDGIFATSDMIGRNGHMRWPEAEIILQTFWPLLTEKQRFHHQLLRHDHERFIDHDCSTEGFEGVRAQDILHLILNRFNPYKFFAFGGFIDVMVDRGYGHGFNADNEWDRNFIKAMANLNDILLDAKVIKPTTMIAYFSKQDVVETHYRDRSAISCLRLPYEHPSWVCHHEQASADHR